MNQTNSRISYERLAFDDVFKPLMVGFARTPQPVLEEWLDGADREEYASLANEGRRTEFGVSRLLVRELTRELKPQSASARLIKDEAGRPEVEIDGRRMPAGLAHTEGAVLAAVSEGREVGVDLEQVDRSVHPRLRRRMLSEEERDLLGSAEETSSLRIWTVKEACLKLGGTGLRKALHSAQITNKRGRYFEALMHDQKKVKICSFRHRAYWLAIAVYIE